VASRPSSTAGSPRGQARAPIAARVVTLAQRDRGVVDPANDNQPPVRRRVVNAVAAGLALALAAVGGLYLYLT
jgi:hypothetical protein